jgi:thiamine monophosphate synthase
MPWIPQTNANLAYWCALLPVPVVAIGGMDVARASQAMRCGAAGVAVISAITAAASPETAIAELSRAIHESAGTAKYQPPALPQSTLSEEGPCSARC